MGSKPYLVVDTGGFEPVVDSGILHEMAKQTLQAVDEADAVVFLVDARTGFNPARQNHRRPPAPIAAPRVFGGKQRRGRTARRVGGRVFTNWRWANRTLFQVRMATAFTI